MITHETHVLISSRLLGPSVLGRFFEVPLNQMPLASRGKGAWMKRDLLGWDKGLELGG